MIHTHAVKTQHKFTRLNFSSVNYCNDDERSEEHRLTFPQPWDTQRQPKRHVDLQPRSPVSEFVLYNNLSSILKWNSRPSPGKERFLANERTVIRAFLRCRDSFRAQNKPIIARVGFHYTRPRSLECSDIIDNIRTRGLLPRGGSGTVRHGAKFGKGIYVSENPHAFCTYGSTGIVVLYLCGTMKQCTKRRDYNNWNRDVASAEGGTSHHDSVRGNKLTKISSDKGTATSFPRSPYFDEIVLRKSEQVLPVLAYSVSAINNAELIHRFQVELQELVDRTLNYPEDYCPVPRGGSFLSPRKTPVPRIYPDISDLRTEHAI